LSVAPLRDRIIDRIAEFKLKDFEAAEEPGLSPGQMSRLRTGDEVFTLDRLIDAPAATDVVGAAPSPRQASGANASRPEGGPPTWGQPRPDL